MLETRGLFCWKFAEATGLFKYQKKITGNLKNSDLIMNNGFWVGVYPSTTLEHLKYVKQKFDIFLSKYK